MQAKAVIFEKPGRLSVDDTVINDPALGDIVVETVWSGVSTGTERLLWEGRMPEFPGMGYPLVPGYEAVGEVVDSGNSSIHKTGDLVFVPGSSSYRDVKGLFGGSASSLVVSEQKATKVDRGLGCDATLLALAATAYRGVTKHPGCFPDLIVGFGVLGRLAARIIVALGGSSPTIWETQAARRADGSGFNVISPQSDAGSQYKTILDVSGNNEIIDLVVPFLSPGGRIILAGFYSVEMKFAFPPAFMKEASFSISAEWKSQDLAAVLELINSGKLALNNLITHQQKSNDALAAYKTAFDDPDCLKMILDWKAS